MPFDYLPASFDGGIEIGPEGQEALLARLDADMAELGAQYKALQDIADAAKKTYDEAKAPAEALKASLQHAAVARSHLTGEKTHGAFQAATETTATFDSQQFLLWVLAAPYQVQMKLLKLDTDATRKWLLERYDADTNAFRQLEECPPFMALHTTKTIGKILSKELGKLPPIKMIQTVVPLPTMQIQPAASVEAMLTIEAVADQIYKTNEEDKPIPF
jgi:hypothetical protein